MEIIYSFIHNYIFGIFILLSYQKILNIKFSKIVYLLGMALIFSGYMFLAHTYIIEPIRAIIGTALLGLLLLLQRQRPFNWAALVLAFLFGYSAWLMSLVLSMVVLAGFLEIASKLLYLYAALFVQALTYLAFHKIIRLKNGIPSIHDSEVKVIIFAVAGIVLAFFGAYHVMFNRLHEANRSLYYAALATLIITISGLAYLIFIFTKRYSERLEAEKQRKELEERNMKLEKDRRALERLHHKYREIVPATIGFHTLLIDKIKSLTETDNDNQAQEVKRYLDLVENLSMEISEEFTLDDMVDEFRGFVLPEEWLPLKIRIVQVIKACEDKGYFAFAQNNATTWGKVTVSQIKFIRLVGNLLSNAVKELDKTGTEEKELRIRFYDDSEFFALEVFDTAHEFPIHILAKLGQRGNSTNGTGDGYAEIFEFLAESGASLIITEGIESGKTAKTVQVVFDHKGRIVIQTGYRYDELNEALVGTRFEVEKIT